MKNKYVIALIVLPLVVALFGGVGVIIAQNTDNESSVQETMPDDTTADSTEAIAEEESDFIETETETETDTEEEANPEVTENQTVTEEEVTENENVTEEDVTEVEPIINANHYSCNLSEIYYTSPIRTYTAEQKELIAKMLYCESGSTSWDCQVATCSAIINLIDHYDGDFSILDKSNVFSPAYFYRSVTPLQTQYDVLEYVLSDHLIADIKYFRTSYYHSFGTPMFAIDNVHFSK